MISLLFGVVFASVVHSASALYSNNDDVVQLTPSNFEKEVMRHDGAVLVEFYAPWCGHCKSMAKDYKKAARALKGTVKVAALDADAHGSYAGKYGVKGFPTIKIFGVDKSKPQDYNQARDAKGFVNAGLRAARELVNARLDGKAKGGSGKSKSSKSSSGGGGKGGSGKGGKGGKVVKVTESTFEELVLNEKRPVLVEFFAPWCGHCKALEGPWKEAASRLGGKVVLAAVDATVESGLAGKYGVQGYPTIKYFKPGSKKPTDYRGGRTTAEIVEWALAKLDTDGLGPEVNQLVSQAVFDENCKRDDATNICFVGVFPDILDSGAKGRNRYIDALKGASKKTRGFAFEFLWTQGGDQSKFEETFNLPFGYPRLVAVHVEKKAYALMVGAFDEKNIVDFINSLKSGKVATRKFKELPKIKTRDPWDGKDGTPPSEDL